MTAWIARAACADTVAPEAFFPPLSDERAEADWLAQEVCGTCPVASDCLAYALEHNCEGIWAGTTTAQRARITDRRKRNARQAEWRASR